MKNLTDSFVYLGHWPSAGSFGFNTDILATNLINLSVVFGVLIFFGKGRKIGYVLYVWILRSSHRHRESIHPLSVYGQLSLERRFRFGLNGKIKWST
jgi:F-type H+-transporting ATPase subunit b